MKPERTCVGCRQRASRSELLRVIVQNQVLIADLKAIMPGRGAWMHSSGKCLELATTRRAFNRALRQTQNLDSSDLASCIEQAEKMLAN
ncbi:MAG: YlxR family protein [Micrococcales bacterium]